MCPDLPDLITWLAFGLLALLLVPKRGWRRVIEHLAQTRRGERRYVFAPPTRQGELAEDFGERWPQLVRREWPRIIELGLPAYALACRVERRSTERRLERAAAWARSPAGLLLEHLAGMLSEAEFHARLSVMGCPRPAAKLASAPPRDYLLPPMSWVKDWHRDQQARWGDRAIGPMMRVERVPSTPSRLTIRTLGEIRLIANGQDYASLLSRKPVLRFIWFYLLALEVRSPGERTARSLLGDELYATYRPVEQRKKVRQRLSDLMTELPDPLRACVRVEEEYLEFDLTGCELDVRRVLDLAAEIMQEGEIRNDFMLQRVHEELTHATREFIPDWEETERKATETRGVAGSIVTEVRNHVAAAHVTLLDAVAGWYLARGQPHRAIAYLEDGLRRRSDRSDLAAILAHAYEQAGQLPRAARLREEYGLGGSC